MLDRSERILKIVCVGLLALLLWQFAQAVITGNPLAKLTIPAVPTLTGGTNAAAGDTNSAARKEPASGGTNSAAKQTSSTPATNIVSGLGAGREGTNSLARRGAVGALSNSIPGQAEAPARTNSNPALAAPGPGTNAVVRAGSTNSSTNGMATLKPGGPGEALAARATGPGRRGSVEMAMAARGAGGRSGGFGGFPGTGGAALPELPAVSKARIERIYRSELLGPVMPPVPAALLGIAGDSAFLRGTNGQTGPVKEGNSLGGIKLLKIGTNRVLIEEDGQKKELTIFSGFGGESLMPKPSDNPQ